MENINEAPDAESEPGLLFLFASLRVFCPTASLISF
jgi:hypothetical protein